VHVTEHYSGLAVAWSEADKKAVQGEIGRLDASLFLDPERCPTSRRLYWTVKQHLGSAIPPHTVLRWQDERGNPKPLTYAIVDELKRRERKDDMAVILRNVDRHNRDLVEKQREKADADYEQIIRDNRKRRSAAYSPGLPPRRFGAGANPKAAA
jgi:hypothetical protein